jgi:branched-chain amino acid transport system permease protein
MKVIAGAVAAFIAGLGGGLLALSQTTFQPSEFATFAGVVWLAVLVTIGVRSNAAALIAGLTFVMVPALAQAYLPAWTANVAPVLFGLGAISAAKYPEGALAEQSRRLRRLVFRVDPALASDLEEPDGPSLSTLDLERADRAVRVAERVP